MQSSAHDVLRVFGTPGHGVVDDVAGWLRAPERELLVAVLPMLIGFLFCVGGGIPPLGNGNATGVAWVLMVPAVAIGGRSVVLPAVGYAFVGFGLLAGFFALTDRSQEDPGFARTFTVGDLRWMAPSSVFHALVLVPFFPVLMLLAAVHRSVTWPDSEAITARFPAGTTESSPERSAA